jgi:hypothetical protein
MVCLQRQSELHLRAFAGGESVPLKSTSTRPPAEHRGVHPPIARGLTLLRQSLEYAVDLTRDPWDFAVEIAALREAGMSNSDLRWLACKEFIEHAAEVTVAGKDGREFRPTGNLTFDERTCFVLTEGGARFAADARQARAESAYSPPDLAFSTACRVSKSKGVRNSGSGPALGAGVAAADSEADGRPVPNWDGSRHELRFKQSLVKIFKLPSPNQEAVLMAFEEEGWPPRIDDPLPHHPELDPKRRLHDTIKGLNRNQKSRLIRFMGDGTGEGIRWEPRVAALKSAGGKAK